MSNHLTLLPIAPVNICKKVKERSSGREIFRIGFSANYGGHTRELYTGLFLAIEEYLQNEEREYDIELLWEDSTFSVESTKKAAVQLINRGAEVVIGHLSANQSMAAANIYSDVGIPFFATGTTHPDLTKQGYDNLVRLCGRDNEMAEKMIEFAMSLSKDRCFEVIYQENSYGEQLSNLLSEKLVERGYKCRKSSYKGNVIASIDPHQTVLYAGTYEGALKLTEELKIAGFKGQIIFGDDIFVADFPYLVNLVTEISLYTISSKQELFGLDCKEFYKKYKKTVLIGPGAYSLTSYLAAKIVLRNIDVLERLGYKKFISKIKNGTKIDDLHTIGFSPNGDVLNFEWDVYKIINKEFLKL